MQKRIRSAGQIMAQLGSFIDSYLAKPGSSQEALATAVGVDQSTISRLRQRADISGGNHAVRLGAGARKLCKYAHIPLAEPITENKEGREVLDVAITEVWNGSLPHARHIAKVILALRGLSTHQD